MRELRPLTPGDVGDLLAPCAPCTFWQTRPHHGHDRPAEPERLRAALAAWVAEVTEDWGPPGYVAYVDGEPAGYVLHAPARLVPRLAAFPTAPSDPATLMLITAWTSPSVSGNGLRKVLVQAAAKDALRHQARSLDAIAARPLAVARHACVLEVAPLEKLGFRVERDHPAYPRLRLDLRTVVTVKDEVTAFVSRAIARIPGARPAPETHPDGATRAREALSRRSRHR
ncbi:GCN5 family acetyltransferase [Intrasporangium oryzae NRRL B-24470]|uniref:GCN5 family acetyltransferase n=1 Tax=Intrasporangium oryzae NRRL B-24470 TaxID=1386089 RepID=W9G6W9_9MICO|nr:GNAT family N-acetyltransferase [Intrasporangium oryzae]EWT01017.1 GCN5 family acetyltransferase [Intrasporangium oryzae NRRL B-24470]